MVLKCFLQNAALLFLGRTVSGMSLSLTSPGCADPSGFDSCMSSANNEAASIFSKYCTTGQCTDPDNCYTPDPNCAATTTCIAYTLWINCALSHCWNRVYSCEYQQLAINAIENCPIASQLPPYIPAPHAAPGGCSCNMGFVYADHLNMNREGAAEEYKCLNNNAASGAKTCRCCAASSATSTFFNACPNTDPSEVPIFNLLGYNYLVSSTCSSALGSGVDCSAQPWGYTIPPGPTYDTSITNPFYNAMNLPANGTQPLSDSAGVISSPISGAVVTWSLYKGSVLTASASVTTFAGGVAAGSTTAASSGPAASVTVGAGSTMTSSTASGSTTVTMKNTAALSRAPQLSFLVGIWFIFLALQ